MQTAHHDPQPPRVSWRHARRAIEIAVGATLGGLIGMTWYGRVNVAGLVTLAVAASIGAGVGLRRAARRRRLPDERDLAIDRLSYMVAAYAMFVTAGVGPARRSPGRSARHRVPVGRGAWDLGPRHHYDRRSAPHLTSPDRRPGSAAYGSTRGQVDRP
jgi:hypothetical protein